MERWYLLGLFELLWYSKTFEIRFFVQCFKCRKRLVDKLVEECNGNNNEKKLLSSEMTNVTLSERKNVCKSCIIYVLLFVILIIISISIGSALIYFHWYLKIKYIETAIYWMQFL